jgi:hypothetical protein
MAITRSNILVLYDSGNSISNGWATDYCAQFGLSSSQKCDLHGTLGGTSPEILANYSTFHTDIEIPVSSYISSHSGLTIYAIVVGPAVPGGFNDSGTVVSTTSRLTRLRSGYSLNTPNPLYDRKSSKRLTDNDLASFYLCSRIDSPSLTGALAITENAVLALNQGSPYGMFNLDPYVVTGGNSAKEQYQTDLLDFEANTLPLLNVNSFVTVSNGLDVDFVIPYAEDESFVWSAGNENSTDSFFRISATRRFFLYNADTDNAASMRDASSTRWPHLALDNGYACAGGAMAFGSAAQYIRPRPFFESLLAGASIAEAYLFATPLLDSPETLFGDPLVTSSFPVTVPAPVLLSTALGTSILTDKLSEAIASIYRKATLSALVAGILEPYAGDYPDLANEAAGLQTVLATSYIDDFGSLSSDSLAMAVANTSTPPTTAWMNTFLSSNSFTVSQLYADALGERSIDVSVANISTPLGLWRFETPIIDPVPGTYTFSHFLLEVATDDAFTNIVASLDSSTTQAGWFYEAESNLFSPITSGGVSSNFAGRYVQFASPAALFSTRGVVYNVRLRQKVGITLYANLITSTAINL